MWSASGGTDIADTRPLVSGAKHHFEAGIENVFAKRGLAHMDNNTLVRILLSRSVVETPRAQNLITSVAGIIRTSSLRRSLDLILLALDDVIAPSLP
jgi:hypothetical protein